MMITKVSYVYQVDTRRHENRQPKDEMKKKQHSLFKDILEKALICQKNKM